MCTLNTGKDYWGRFQILASYFMINTSNFFPENSSRFPTSSPGAATRSQLPTRAKMAPMLHSCTWDQLPGTQRPSGHFLGHKKDIFLPPKRHTSKNPPLKPLEQHWGSESHFLFIGAVWRLWSDRLPEQQPGGLWGSDCKLHHKSCLQ